MADQRITSFDQRIIASSETASAYGRLIHHCIAEYARAQAHTREELLREVAATYLPRWLRWAVRWPKVMAAIYRLRPNWRPTISWGVDGDITVGMVLRADGVAVIL